MSKAFEGFTAFGSFWTTNLLQPGESEWMCQLHSGHWPFFFLFFLPPPHYCILLNPKTLSVASLCVCLTPLRFVWVTASLLWALYLCNVLWTCNLSVLLMQCFLFFFFFNEELLKWRKGQFDYHLFCTVWNVKCKHKACFSTSLYQVVV